MKETLKTLVAWLLALEARMVLKRHQPRIIAVTGNVGKTSTKEAVFAAIAGDLSARKSVKSLNSEFGVPLTIIGQESGWNSPLRWFQILWKGLLAAFVTKTYPQWLVLEVGADRPGDIKRIAKWLKPHIVIVTGIPDVPVHVEFFGSPEELAAEKYELAKALTKGGTLILNGDDERTLAMKQDFWGVSVTYGLDKKNDVHASHVSVQYDQIENRDVPVGMQFRVNSEGASVPVTLTGVLGKTHVYPVLAAIAAAKAAGLDAVSAGRAFEEYQPLPGRMRLVPGTNGATIIDDSYNASPAATLAALDTLAELRTRGRKIAVLGDMLELGTHTSSTHRRVGERAAAVADALLAVGIRSKSTIEAARAAGMSEDRTGWYDTGKAAQVGADLAPALEPGDVVLVKGSQSMRMEKAIEKIMADPSRRAEMLPRQEKEWAHR